MIELKAIINNMWILRLFFKVLQHMAEWKGHLWFVIIKSQF